MSNTNNVIMKVSEDDYLIKHTAVIQMASDLTLLQSKMLNVLLKKAQSTLKQGSEHTITKGELARLAEYDSRDYRKMMRELNKMPTTEVVFNLFGKDQANKERWNQVTSGVISHIDLNESGEIRYGFSAPIARLLQNPNIYAKINLQVEGGFKSKYAFKLYEFFKDTLGNRPLIRYWMDIDEIRTLLTLGTRYKAPSDFNRRVLEPALKAINTVSDISVVDTGKEEFSGRRLKKILLEIKIQKKKPVTLENESPIIMPGYEKACNELRELIGDKAEHFIHALEEEDLIGNMAIHKKRQEEAPGGAHIGYLIEALKNNYFKDRKNNAKQPEIQSRPPATVQKRSKAKTRSSDEINELFESLDEVTLTRVKKDFEQDHLFKVFNDTYQIPFETGAHGAPKSEVAVKSFYRSYLNQFFSTHYKTYFEE